MNAQDFFKKHGGAWVSILSSDLGKDLISYLQSAKPKFQPLQHQHLILDLYASIRGYDQCVKNLMNAVNPPSIKDTPVPDYGIKKPDEPAPFISDAEKTAIVPSQPKT